jgi:hypothetical protein
MLMAFSFAVLRKRGEFSSQHTGDGEVDSTDTVLYHVGRSMGVGNGSTWALSSGVEGVIGDGERERAFVREGEEGDMGEIKKARGMEISAHSLALNAEEGETRPRLASEFRRVPLILPMTTKASIMRSSRHFTP